MSNWVIPPPAQTSVPVAGSDALFPVRRIYCVGRNYEAHAREMGGDPKRESPFYFMKPTDALQLDGAAIPYPPRTANFHHEIEFVAALSSGGRDIKVADALDHVFGYAVGNDLTRRDLQLAARDKGRPWFTGKSFEHCATISPIRPARTIGHPKQGRIWLTVNGAKRQDSDINGLIWNVAEVIADLSTYFELRAGDLIYTGTPDGVGPLKVGDKVEGGIDGIGTLTNTIV